MPLCWRSTLPQTLKYVFEMRNFIQVSISEPQKCVYKLGHSSIAWYLKKVNLSALSIDKLSWGNTSENFGIPLDLFVGITQLWFETFSHASYYPAYAKGYWVVQIGDGLHWGVKSASSVRHIGFLVTMKQPIHLNESNWYWNQLLQVSRLQKRSGLSFSTSVKTKQPGNEIYLARKRVWTT